MRKVLPFTKKPVIRCTACGKIKPENKEGVSHRGIDYSGGTKATYWTVFPSGWKMTEVVPVKVKREDSWTRRKRYYQCPDCRKVAE